MQRDREKVRSPTGRMIFVGGDAFRKYLTQGYVNHNGRLALFQDLANDNLPGHDIVVPARNRVRRPRTPRKAEFKLTIYATVSRQGVVGEARPIQSFNCILPADIENAVGNIAPENIINILEKTNQNLQANTIQNLLSCTDHIELRRIRIVNENQIAMNPARRPLRDWAICAKTIEYPFISNNITEELIKDRLKTCKPFSCFQSAILFVFAELFQNAKEERRRKKLDYSIFPNEDGSLSCEEAVECFFKPYQIPCIILGIDRQVIFGWHPEMVNMRKNPRFPQFYGLLHDGHLYVLDKDIKALNQYIHWDRETQTFTSNNNWFQQRVSSYYRISETLFYNECKVYTGLEQVIALLGKEAQRNTALENIASSSSETPQQVTYNLLVNAPDLTGVLFEMVKNRIEPTVEANSMGHILQLTLSQGDITVRLVTSNTRNNNQIVFESPEEQMEYLNVQFEFERNFINPGMKSEYHPTVYNVFRKLFRSPLVKPFEKGRKDGQNFEKSSAMVDTFGFDVCRAYTDCLMSFDEIPVLTPFDVPMPYENGDEIKNTDICICIRENNSNSLPIIFDNRICVLTGYAVNKYDLKHTVQRIIRCSRTVPNPAKKVVDELYRKVGDKQAKLIVNSLVGKTCKLKNKKTASIITRDLEEAEFYKHQNDAQVVTVVNPQDEYDEIYAVVKNYEAELCDGFYPIQLFVYDFNRMKMQDIYNALIEIGEKPIGIKTDCLYVSKPIRSRYSIEEYMKIHKSPVEKFTEKFPEMCYDKTKSPFENIGKIRFVEEKYSGSRLKERAQEWSEIVIEPKIAEVIEMKDEYSSAEFAGIVKGWNVLVCGEYAGTGKSMSIQTFVRNAGLKALFVCPDNALGEELERLGFAWATCNGFFGIGINNESLPRKFDTSGYDTIVFEEIYKNNYSFLKRIATFMRVQKEKFQFFANGDAYQLRGINEDPMKMDFCFCLSLMFDKRINLKINKSLPEAERKNLIQLKADIFGGKFTMKQLCVKYFKPVSEPMKNALHICSTNAQAQLVNNYLRGGNTAICEGDRLVFRTRPSTKGADIFTINAVYTVVGIGRDLKGDYIELRDWDGKVLKATKSLVHCHFEFEDCGTCHSLQGKRTSKDIVLVGMNEEPQYLWTAVTRARSFEQVHYLTKNLVGEVYECNNRKIAGYKEQDKRKGRMYVEDEYITADWVNKRLKDKKYRCEYCWKGFVKGKIEFEVDRINNNIAHTKENCQILCTSCNGAKK